ncbi:hypothetical protein GF336_05435 [Candidatus Woesearchaeota archaeon]|nr:hypothetical protein [Candidatus Woesearchaeota archaeon]
MLEDLLYERKVYRILKKLSKQRVAQVLSGPVWIIEQGIPDDPEIIEVLNTSWMRGWVEPLEEAIPKGKLKDGMLPENPLDFTSTGTLWKLTDSGWNVIHRTHQMRIYGMIIAVIGIILALK